MHQEEGLKFCLDIINNGALLFDMACLKCLSVESSTDLPYIKLVEFNVIQVIGLLKNECCLSMFTFKKIKLQNKLITHLELIIHMFNHMFFTLQAFPFGQQFQIGNIIELDMKFEGCPSFTFFSFASYIMII